MHAEVALGTSHTGSTLTYIK